MNKIPPELVSEIINCFDIDDLKQFALVSKELGSLCKERLEFLRKVMSQDFSSMDGERIISAKFYKYCIKLKETSKTIDAILNLYLRDKETVKKGGGKFLGFLFRKQHEIDVSELENQPPAPDELGVVE